MTQATKLKLAMFALAPSFALAAPAQHGFDNLTCQSNIEQELAGRQMPNDPVAKLEARYKNLKLQ
ncbi:MAG: hypothetical protein JO002_00710, partial [Burkholderiaceae bacterium]|nr:hypothetical protein [Burkholderiaceae bacterium]